MLYTIKDRSPEFYAICECIDITKKIIPSFKRNENDDFVFDIQLIVGGVELDFTKVLNRLYDKHEEYVDNEAKAIVTKKYDELFDMVDKLKEKVEDLTARTNEDWD